MANESIPDVAISETAHLSAMAGFGVLALALFGGFMLALWLRKRSERDGIYSKYRLPGDRPKARR